MKSEGTTRVVSVNFWRRVKKMPDFFYLNKIFREVDVKYQTITHYPLYNDKDSCKSYNRIKFNFSVEKLESEKIVRSEQKKGNSERRISRK